MVTYRIPLFFVHNGFFKLPRSFILKLALLALSLHFLRYGVVDCSRNAGKNRHLLSILFAPPVAFLVQLWSLAPGEPARTSWLGRAGAAGKIRRVVGRVPSIAAFHRHFATRRGVNYVIGTR